MVNLLLTRTHHIEINIHKTTKKMVIFFYCRCVLAILPKYSFAIFSLIMFRPSSPCHELYQPETHKQRGSPIKY